jgi:hypothetical protein
METSLETLVKIAERDNVTDNFRRTYLTRNLFGKYKLIANNFTKSITLGVASFVVGLYSVNTMVNEDYSFNIPSFILCGGAVVAGILGMYYNVKNQMLRSKLAKDFNFLNLTKYEDVCCCLDGRVSNRETVVEKNFGGRIKILENVEEVYDVKKDKEYNYGFIMNEQFGFLFELPKKRFNGDFSEMKIINTYYPLP